MELGLCSGMHEEYCGEAKTLIPPEENAKPPYKEAYDYLAAIATKKKERKSVSQPGRTPCTKRILEILSETNGKGISLHDLKKQLDEEKYTSENEYAISNALRTLRRTNRIITEGPSNSPDKIIKLPKQK